MIQINKKQTKKSTTRNKNTLYCFSPLVMIITFVVEIALAIYTFLRIKPSRIKNIISASLVLLAVFQLVEFFVCGSYSSFITDVSSRIGFVAITFLPALGVTLANELAGRKNHWSSALALLTATGFAVFFGFAPSAVNNSICTGNYVIFILSEAATAVYSSYYFGLLLITLAIVFVLAGKQKSKVRRNSLHWLGIGTLSFLVPTGIVYWVVPSSELAIPSVMCGFAIIYAIILAFIIAPQTSSAK